ncbi:hypothetical protein C8R44DRAFT_946338 [Mycena epipterygia]|nr:hypothetical protein C8R44DRAFT_946338 [Mycena epipterygia]
MPAPLWRYSTSRVFAPRNPCSPEHACLLAGVVGVRAEESERVRGAWLTARGQDRWGPMEERARGAGAGGTPAVFAGGAAGVEEGRVQYAGCAAREGGIACDFFCAGCGLCVRGWPGMACWLRRGSRGATRSGTPVSSELLQARRSWRPEEEGDGVLCGRGRAGRGIVSRTTWMANAFEAQMYAVSFGVHECTSMRVGVDTRRRTEATRYASGDAQDMEWSSVDGGVARGGDREGYVALDRAETSAARVVSVYYILYIGGAQRPVERAFCLGYLMMRNRTLSPTGPRLKPEPSATRGLPAKSARDSGSSFPRKCAFTDGTDAHGSKLCNSRNSHRELFHTAPGGIDPMLS